MQTWWSLAHIVEYRYKRSPRLWGHSKPWGTLWHMSRGKVETVHSFTLIHLPPCSKCRTATHYMTSQKSREQTLNRWPAMTNDRKAPQNGMCTFSTVTLHPLNTQTQHVIVVQQDIMSDRRKSCEQWRASARSSPFSSDGAHLRAISCTPRSIMGCPGVLKQVVLRCSEP